jgi:glycosyltransferase involved in cell wall biosynthesis
LQNSILLVWDRIGDYHIARKRALEESFTGKVYSADLAANDHIYGWETISEKTHFPLSQKAIHSKDLKKRISRLKTLVEEKQITHLAIAGYGRKDYRFIIKLGKRMGCKILVFSESWYKSFKVKEAYKKYFIRRYIDHLFVSGERASDYYSNYLKIEKSKITKGYSVVDNPHFIEKAKIQKKEKVLLCVARFSEEKNLIRLIEAFKESSISTNWKLKIIGGGPLFERLKQVSTSQILLIQWLNYDALPEQYHKSSAFILPSIFEPWGLVVNEAMVAGLPVLFSEELGCLPDLYCNNGFRFNPHSHQSMVESLNKLHAATDEELERWGENSKERINEFTCKHWANNLLKAFQLDGNH